MLTSTWYDDTVDTWALGCILFELVTGKTPFHCQSEDELIQKINDGRYRMATKGEPLFIETCMFLVHCLQVQQEDRMGIDQLL